MRAYEEADILRSSFPILRIRDRNSGTAPGESICGLPAICGRDFRAAWIVKGFGSGLPGGLDSLYSPLKVGVFPGSTCLML